MSKPSQPIFHKAALLLIRKTLKARWGKISKRGSPIDGAKAFIKKNEKEFLLAFAPTFIVRRLETGEYVKKVEFKSGRETVIIESLFINSYSPPKYTGQANFLYTKGFSKKKKQYFRFIVPLSKEIKFHNILETRGYKTDLGYSSSCSSQAIINEELLSVYILHDENKNYFLSIESNLIQDFQIFSNKAFAIINGIGYLTGILAGDFGWFIYYSERKKKTPRGFYFCSLRGSIISTYTPTNSNPYSHLNHKRKMAERLYKAKTLRNISIVEFSSLCQKLHDSMEFTSAIILMLESSVASFLFMPGGYAIALESLSDLILGKGKLKLAPIKDKSQSRKIISEFKAIIAKHAAGLDPDDMELLKKRIEGINQITNKARLQAPFKKLGIRLLDKDLEVLNSRNDFLHGRFPDFSKAGPARSNDRINRDLVFAAYRFYTILNILILKWIGYNNKVINYSKISEGYCKIKLKEDYFRQV